MMPILTEDIEEKLAQIISVLRKETSKDAIPVNEPLLHLDRRGRTIIHRHSTLLQLLITYQPELTHECGLTQLSLAAFLGDANAVISLLNTHSSSSSTVSDINAEGEAFLYTKPTALWWAVHGGNEEIVKILLSRGADINKCIPLSRAVLNGNIPMINLLLSHGADVNKHTDTEFSPLLIHCSSLQMQ